MRSDTYPLTTTQIQTNHRLIICQIQTNHRSLTCQIQTRPNRPDPSQTSGQFPSSVLPGPLLCPPSFPPLSSQSSSVMCRCRPVSRSENPYPNRILKIIKSKSSNVGQMDSGRILRSGADNAFFWSVKDPFFFSLAKFPHFRRYTTLSRAIS